MDLYTSIVRLKQEIRGGALPPMTPLPESAKVVINPAFTIGGDGLGGLVEDEARGLRCPVRGCGEWFHVLTKHLNDKHGDVGGAAEVRRLLEIPPSVSLASHRVKANCVARNLARDAAGALARWRAAHPGEQARRAKAGAARRGRAQSAAFRSTNMRNLRDACPAQLGHKLIDLQHQIGRSPSAEDARALLGPGFVSLVQSVFGTWNNAKAQCEMERWKTSRKKFTLEQVLAALRAWHTVHGSLPSSKQARRIDRAPLIMDDKTIMAMLGTTSWPQAMRRVGHYLGIDGSQIGVRRTNAERAA